MLGALFPVGDQSHRIQSLAKEIFSEAADVRLASVSELLQIAQSLEGIGEYLNAYRLYCLLESAGLRTYRQQANCLFLCGELELAKDLFRQELSTTQFDELHPWTIMQYGLCIERLGATQQDLDLMRSLWRPGSAILPAVATLFGELFLHLGMWDKAAEFLEPYHHSNHSRLFTCLSIALLRRSIPGLGGGIRASEADSSARGHASKRSIGFSCSSLNCYGRFGQTLTEYFVLQRLGRDSGRVLSVPSWVGEYVFLLDNPRYHGGNKQLRVTERAASEAIDALGAGALEGVDMFSPGSFENWSPKDYDYARSLFKFRPEIEAWLSSLIGITGLLNREILAVHLRLGDQASRTRTLPRDVYRSAIERISHELNNPVLYLATDEIDKATEFLGIDGPITTNEIAEEVPIGLRWLVDFYIFTRSQAVITHQSSFSYWGCVLNREGVNRFLQPDILNSCFIEFDPLRFNTTAFSL